MLSRAVLFLLAMMLAAHPMGNFSVSHYARIEVGLKSVNVTYVLDLAEIPTYQLMREWKLDPAADAKIPQAALDEKAAQQASEWIKSLEFYVGGKRVEPKLEKAAVKLSDGAGGMRIARIESTMHLDAPSSKLDFEDKNYPERAGWKEIVITSAAGAEILEASQSAQERSKALTEYPSDPTLAPPQDLRASVEWRNMAPTAAPQVTKVPKIVPIPQPAPPATQASTPAPSPAAKAAPGEVTRGDFLSRILGKREISWQLMLLATLAAFGFGALHARSPGHGKTMVAAYLVGSRGTIKHAVFLGAMVTFTHTISVFALGIVTLAFSSVLPPEKLTTWLGAISGLSIVAIGASLFWKRLRKLRQAQAHKHAHEHVHAHAHHHHSHDHHHLHDHHHHTHDHSHDHHDHSHGPHSHTHVPEGEVTLSSLIALGISGGLVPCPSALVLLLVSISLGHIGLGLILLVAFSLGLAGVLMAIGILVIYAKQWLPDPVKASQHPAFKLVPVFSALVVMCIGLIMTGVSLGWLKPGVFAS